VRVLLVSDFFPPVKGGMEYHVDALAEALVLRGHDVAVATLTPDAVARNPAVKIFKLSAAATRILPHEEDHKPHHPPLPDPLAHRGFVRLLKDFRPEIIHGHSWLTVSLPRSRKAPLVLTAHDYGLVCQLRTLYKPEGVVCGGPSAACVRCGAAQYGRAKSAALTLGTTAGRHWIRPAGVIAVSTSVQRSLQPHLRVPVAVVPNFIPDVDESPPAGADEPDRGYVMFAGDPSRHKGIEVLLDCWRRPDPPRAELLIAAMREVKFELPPGVRVVKLQRSEMAAAWAGALVAVVPSLWPDPSPTVAIEAMAAGTPIIASNIGGLEDMIVDGVTGYHVRPGDVSDLKGRIDQLLEDEPLRHTLGAAARDHAKPYRASVVVPQIEEIYRRSVEAHR
jgi:glycogen(starch) synthase